MGEAVGVAELRETGLSARMLAALRAAGESPGTCETPRSRVGRGASMDAVRDRVSRLELRGFVRRIGNVEHRSIPGTPGARVYGLTRRGADLLALGAPTGGGVRWEVRA